jgi:hypothetical protein
MLRSRQLFNNIRRYTHTNNSPSSNKKLDITVEEKIDEIMSKVNQIDILVKFNYALAVLPGLLYFFK